LVTNLIYKAESVRSSLLHHLIPVSEEAAESNLGGGKIEADTQLFEPGALPTGEGSSVNTYKDIFQGLVTNLIYKAESVRSSLLHHLIPVSEEAAESVFELICDKVIADCIAPKPSLRKASAIWLLSLVKKIQPGLGPDRLSGIGHQSHIQG
jgi:hypothetical protein